MLWGTKLINFFLNEISILELDKYRFCVILVVEMRRYLNGHKDQTSGRTATNKE